MNSSETRVPSVSGETLELVEDRGEHHLGVSALVSRLNCSSSGSDAGSQGSPETEGCGLEDPKEKNFPWANSFSKLCRASIGSRSMKQLDDLLSVYIEHVTPHYRDCHKKQNKAAKLKRNINDTMIFFHMLYMDIREPLENAFYFDKMTELMAMYLDLEITAAKRGRDTEKTVTNKLSTSLYTFLDHSEDHILDALLKTKLINKHSNKVCVPLLRKILSELVVRRPLAELTYVRFLLSFKLWKSVVADVEERRAINKLAARRLHPPPEYFMDHEIVKPNADVLPRVPKSKKDCTSFYLVSKFNVKNACRAFFRYCKDTCRSNVYRRNITGSYEMEKSFMIRARSSSDLNVDAEESGSCSLINDIWSAISNGDSGPSLLGESSSDIFSDVHVEEKATISPVKNKSQPDSPDSGIDAPDRIRRKDNRKKKDNSVPDPKYVILKTGSVIDPMPAASPAKGVQDCCLGSVFMEQVNKVGGGQSHVKADPSEAELPTSSRQHSGLESLVYVQPGSDNEAVASSSVSPDGSSVPTSHRDTNECDSSVEILQPRQVSADVSLPLDLKPSLNMDEDLRSGKAQKEELLLFGGGDTVADDGGAFESPFADFTMFRLNDDIFNCRSFEGMDQSSMMFRRADVTGSLPFQGTPLLEEDEDDLSSKFRWSSVPDYHPSVQSTIINQSSGTGSTVDFSTCYAGMESKSAAEDNEEPKLGQDIKSGKGATPGMLWHNVMVGNKVMRIPSFMLARYKAAYQFRSRSMPHTQSQPPSNPVPPPVSISHSISNNLIVEGSDNLKILAEQAVRVRDASVAEVKCKSELAANLNLPLKKRKSLAPVGDVDNTKSKLTNGETSYPSAPMLSIAQVQGVNKSVIVMNSQYSWPSGQPSVSFETEVKSKCSTAVPRAVDSVYNKPIDMSAAKRTVHHQNVDNSTTSSIVKQVVPPMNSVRKRTSCGEVGCSGNCNLCHGSFSYQEQGVKVRSYENHQKAMNGILKTRAVHSLKGSKCQHCHIVNCDGSCKLGASAYEGMKVQKVTFQDSSTKTVLKCIQCKSPGCNGKCMASHSRCSTASSNSRKTQRCVLCKIPSCNGLCKSSALKCSVCFSASCEGTCYLSGRSTNNSLSTVNDFSILNSAFIDKQQKCSMCRGTSCCGKCKNGAGFKHCPYCSVEVCNGGNINHSIRSILGAASKAKTDTTVNTQKRPKAPSSSRRTRSSSSTSKQLASGSSNDTQTFSVEDVKRRKKNMPKSVAR